MNPQDLTPDNDVHADSGSAQYRIRLEKVAKLREKGIEPWPTAQHISITCAQAHAEYTPDSTSEHVVAGRLMTIREHGKSIFVTIQDRTGSLQLYIKADRVGAQAFADFKEFFDVGDIISAKGILFVTRTGEITLQVDSFTLLSKCLHPLPDKFHGVHDTEVRYRQRYLDLICNPDSRAKFIMRSRIIQGLRSFLIDRDFLEVETPMLHPIPGGAAARPFITHHNAYDIDLYLRIAPELYLKRLVVGGFERVFEINRNFRNEGVSTRHNPEFTMLECYCAHADYRFGMELTEQMIGAALNQALGTDQVMYGETLLSFKAPFRRLTVEESLYEVAGFTPEQLAPHAIDSVFIEKQLEFDYARATYGDKLFFLFEEFVEGLLMQPTFIIGHPIDISPLARRDAENPFQAARFELFAGGIELANGFSELNDPIDQADRFKQQVEQRECGFDEAHRYDADFVQALEYGMPPTVGIGVGIDRLVMFLTDTHSIKDVILFPTMRPRFEQHK